MLVSLDWVWVGSLRLELLVSIGEVPRIVVWYGLTGSRLDFLFGFPSYIYSVQARYGYCLIVRDSRPLFGAVFGCRIRRGLLCYRSVIRVLEFGMDYRLIVVILAFGFRYCAWCRVVLLLLMVLRG